MNGQIKPGSFEGNEISKIINRQDIKTIVESGTWYGGGTTLCVLKDLRDDQEFFTIELYPDIFEIAKKNLKEYLHLSNFHMLNGALINFKQIFYFDHLKEINFAIDNHAKLWYEKDLINLKNSKNVLSVIPNCIDFLILDGGEWSTYPEWENLKDRTKIVFLDDTRSFKTKKIRSELLNNTNYKIIIDKTIDTKYRGFSIFEKIR